MNTEIMVRTQHSTPDEAVNNGDTRGDSPEDPYALPLFVLTSICFLSLTLHLCLTFLAYLMSLAPCYLQYMIQTFGLL